MVVDRCSAMECVVVEPKKVPHDIESGVWCLDIIDKENMDKVFDDLKYFTTKSSNGTVAH